VFDNWTGSVAGIADVSQSSVSFKMSDVRTIMANFVPSDLRHTLTATVEPSSGGSITFSVQQPAGGYLINQSISVIALPKTGYSFNHWSEDLTGIQSSGTILMSENKSIVAVFNATVMVYASPSEMGSISPQPGPDGYALGTEVTFTATPTKGYRFVSWGGDASGSSKTLTITIDSPKTITATFEKAPPSRWWLWVMIGIAGLLAMLVVLGLVRSRMDTQWDDESPPSE
jgi:uncharacterized repeat protein (TIGR02543 family)